MEKESPFKKTALALTRWIGSQESLFVHTLLFSVGFFAVLFHFIAFEIMLLILTTIVSLEAIYLSIFIQMSINFTTASIQEVEQDIDEIQEDVEEMSEEDAGEEKEEGQHQKTPAQIQADLRKLMDDISKLQQPKA